MADVTTRFTRKVGPLPVYAWALLVLAAFLAYRHFSSGGAKGSTSKTDTSDNPDDTGTYIPGFDQPPGGGAYNTPGAGTIYNYYYGNQNAVQASGGGTSNGIGGGGSTGGGGAGTGGGGSRQGGGGSTGGGGAGTGGGGGYPGPGGGPRTGGGA